MKTNVIAWSAACWLLARAGLAAGLEVQSFDGAGRLTFSEVSSAVVYRVEARTSQPADQWSVAAPGLDGISPSGSGTVSCTVDVSAAASLYRIVALTSPAYLVVDLADGPTATTYPVTALTEPPPGGWTDAYKTTKLVLRRVPAGTFMMGSPTNELGHWIDETQHQVTLTQDIYVGVFEVTQRQWERVMGNWPSWFDNNTYRDSRPVEQVAYAAIRGANAGANWPTNSSVDADSFMGRLRARTGRMFDLPTESQWEYAGRAGTQAALNSGVDLTSEYGVCTNLDGLGRYWDATGDDPAKSSDTAAGTAEVGSYQPNGWGLYDMHGNVWEWCLDRYGAYPGDAIDPQGDESGAYRTLRGGSWYDYAHRCRMAARLFRSPETVSYNGGFRVVMLPGSPGAQVGTAGSSE